MKITHHILFYHFTKLRNTYIHTVFQRNSWSFCTAFYEEVGTNVLWCNLNHTFCYSSIADPGLCCPKCLGWRTRTHTNPSEQRWIWLITGPIFDIHLFSSQPVLKVICTSKYFAGLRPNITNEANQTELSMGTRATGNRKWHLEVFYIPNGNTSQ